MPLIGSPGLGRVLFKEFVFTLAIAVIMSGVVAVTLSPIMSAYMAPERGREAASRAWSAAFRPTARRLRRAPRRCSAVPCPSPRLWRLHLCARGAALPVLGQGTGAVEDQGVVFLLVNSAPDATLAYTAGHMDKVYETGRALPEFKAMFEVVFPSNGLAAIC